MESMGVAQNAVAENGVNNETLGGSHSVWVGEHFGFLEQERTKKK